MQIEMLRAKLHRVTTTRADLNYEGSISIDRDFMDAAGLFANEKVDVLDINNGARFTTYVIEAERGSKTIGVNGAAARLVQTDDRLIVISYCSIDIKDAPTHKPKVVLFDDDNVIKEII